MSSSSLSTPPGWAFSWCWFFFVTSIIGGLTALLTVILIVISYSKLVKHGHVALLSVYVLALLTQAVTAMVTFWMCRVSLKPSA